MDTLSRGPIYRSDASGETPIYSDGYQLRLANWRESAYAEAVATAELNPESTEVRKYIGCLEGKGWWNPRRARYKSRFFDNRMNNARQSDLALLTDIRPTIDVATKIPAYKPYAEMAAGIIHYEWSKNDMDLSLVRVADICKLNGTSFWKIGAALPGSMQVIPCGPESVLPIQPGFGIQESTAVLYRTYKTLAYLRNKFPYSAVGLERESNFYGMSPNGETRLSRPPQMSEYTWNGLSPQMQRAFGVQTAASTMSARQTFPSLELQEFYVDDPAVNESKYPVLMRHPFLSLEQHNYWYWVQPGDRLYPRKRLIVFAGRKLMYDGPAPFWHGQYPFACMRLNPVPWSFWGLSKYRDLLPLNEAMNEIVAGVMDAVKIALNPIVVSKANAVPMASWNQFYPGVPGGKLMLMPNANIGDIQYLPDPAIPAYVFQIHQYLSAELDRLSGAMDVAALGKKKQVPGGDTIEQMRDMLNSTTRLEGRYQEVFLRDAGQQAVSNVFQHYTLERRMEILSEQGIMPDETLSSMIPANAVQENFWRNFAMTIGQGTLLNSAKDRDKQVAMSLAAKGLFPIQAMYRSMGLPNAAQLLKELVEERKMGLETTGRSPRETRGERNGKVA